MLGNPGSFERRWVSRGAARTAGSALLFASLLISGCAANSTNQGAEARAVKTIAVHSLIEMPGNHVAEVVSAQLIPNPYTHRAGFKWPSMVWMVDLKGTFPMPKQCVSVAGTFKCRSPKSFHTATVFINPKTKTVLEETQPATQQ